MNKILSAGITTASMALGMIATSAGSEDASWGCQILLCAASSNPSWQNVDYCVPPMTKLISAMNKPGFSWPICHEAKAGRPGHEVYEDCPTGTTIGYGVQQGDTARSEPDQCVRTVNLCQGSPDRDAVAQALGTGNRHTYGDDNGGCIQQISTPRPRRTDPYFFDIPNAESSTQRFWFNLNH